MMTCSPLNELDRRLISINMISLRVLFFVTLAVRGLDCVRDGLPWSSPRSFAYKYEDILHLNIFLQNVPPSANSYVLNYQTDHCDENVIEKSKQPGSPCTVSAPNHKIPADGKILITQKLNKASVRLYVVLRNSNKACSNKIIMEGVRDEHADKVVRIFRQACLNQYNRLCQINVDFENKCEAPVTIKCAHESQSDVRCVSPDEELPKETVHQWYQGYSDGPLIGIIPPIKGKKTNFIMRPFQKFDLHTFIWIKDLTTEKVKISSPLKKIKKYEIQKNETYSESEKINFTCANTAHTQIGWIDPTGCKITTYNVTSYSWNFNKTDSNSMLCCLHYNAYEKSVERSVDNITVLIYKETVKQNNGYASSPEPEAPQSTTPSEKTQDQQHKGPQSDLGQPASYTTKYYIVIASVAVIIILISLIYIVIKKCYRKSSDPDQTLQLETYASTNAVLYAELYIKPGNSPPPASKEDPTYAEIIGELRPQNPNNKK